MGWVSMLGYHSPEAPWGKGPRVVALGRACAGSRYLRQEAEVSAQDGFVGVMEELQETARQEVEGVGRGQLREELLLLRLEVQDFGLRVAEGKKVQGLEDCYVPCPPSHVPSATKP